MRQANVVPDDMDRLAQDIGGFLRRHSSEVAHLDQSSQRLILAREFFQRAIEIEQIDLLLRGLAARAPYFHNGSAASLSDVIDFYDQRFNIGFTPREKQDLIAFLNAL